VTRRGQTEALMGLLLPPTPAPSPRRLAVRVTRDAERQLRAGHPWVFDGSITSVSHDGAPGDLAVVFDHQRDFLAIGLWDPTSPIRLRVLHAGSPTPIGPEFWSDALMRSLDRREELRRSTHTNAYRLVHGENDGLPGLVVDQYDQALVMKLYTSAWLPHLAEVAEILCALIDATVVIVRLSRAVGRSDWCGLADGDVVLGEIAKCPVEFREYGRRFGADLRRGPKTGHFLDQRDNRQRVAALAAGADLLDVFSSTGGFSVHSAAAGAASVHLVDQSEPALAEARANLERNRDHPAVTACRVSTQAGDAFTGLAELAAAGRRFDVVVLDPPSFANRAADVAAARRAYSRLTALVGPLVAPGGWLFQASCSSRITEEALRDSMAAGARSAGVAVHIQESFGHPLDHPVGFAQGGYLKALLARVP